MQRPQGSRDRLGFFFCGIFELSRQERYSRVASCKHWGWEMVWVHFWGRDRECADSERLKQYQRLQQDTSYSYGGQRQERKTSQLYLFNLSEWWSAGTGTRGSWPFGSRGSSSSSHLLFRPSGSPHSCARQGIEHLLRAAFWRLCEIKENIDKVSFFIDSFTFWGSLFGESLFFTQRAVGNRGRQREIENML